MALALTTLEDQRTYFHATVPSQLVHHLGRLVVDVYRTVDERCENDYAREERQYIQPHLRRADIEKALSMVPGHFPGVVTMAKPRNVGGNMHYTELLVGADVVITVSHVDRPGLAVPEALFRASLARSSQLKLFEPVLPVAEGTRLWAVVIHGPDRLYSDLPAFIHVVFPIENGTYAKSIDVIDLFPDLAADTRGVAVEKVEESTGVRLKPRVAETEMARSSGED